MDPIQYYVHYKAYTLKCKGLKDSHLTPWKDMFLYPLWNKYFPMLGIKMTPCRTLTKGQWICFCALLKLWYFEVLGVKKTPCPTHTFKGNQSDTIPIMKYDSCFRYLLPWCTAQMYLDKLFIDNKCLGFPPTLLVFIQKHTKDTCTLQYL